MNKTELAPGILIYNNVMNDHESFIIDLEDAVSSDLNSIKWAEPYVLKEGQPVVDHNIRSLDALGINYEQSKILKNEYSSPEEAFYNILGNRLYLALDPLEKDYQSHYSTQMVWHDMYNVLKYGKDHFFHSHIDDNQQYHRRISVVWYANDNYDGGEITFNRFGLSVKPEANSLLVFPSTYVYDHEVKPVTDGFRYAVVSWLH